MAPSHLMLFLACFLALPTFLTFLSLLYSHPPKGEMETETAALTGNGRLLAFFSFQTPSTLFPSSAIISLTDDNSTFFLARPADFGPNLAPDGLSGQLWIGNGFGDGNLKSGTTTLGAEGELGCSDVPGWGESDMHFHDDSGDQARYMNAHADIPESGPSSSNVERARPTIGKEDGTDDHLHEPRMKSSFSKSAGLGEASSQTPNKHRYSSPHADIQSLQEGAEIAGKIVLLSRGGCGFLEKVMWAQRRGGAALIVGDDTPGGPLLTMFAREDTSNVAIPSLFTSHTTAHLLSTLIPLDGPARKLGLKDASKPGSSEGKSGSVTWRDRGVEAKTLDNDRAIFNRAATGPKSTTLAWSRLADPKNEHRRAQRPGIPRRKDQDLGWFHYLLSVIGLHTRSRVLALSADSRRPPSSGRLDWINEQLNVDLQSAQNEDLKHTYAVANHGTDMKGRSLVSPPGPVDDFIIGVQDWRDKDLVAASSSFGNEKNLEENFATKPKSLLSKTAAKAGEKSNGMADSLTGGIITPGSGEYGSTGLELRSKDTPQAVGLTDGDSKGTEGSRTWLSHMLYREDEEDSIPRELSTSTSNPELAVQHAQESLHIRNHNALRQQGEHEGLWVTLTPTTLSTSPFFDTLLVLVVSPLITLTVVYALLLLRSRIRRRRWRAPKSVVERLPVRTYHTMSCSSNSSSSQSATPPALSPTSPLSEAHSPSESSCPRPRSRSTSIVSSLVPAAPDQAVPVLTPQRSENRNCPPATKRKYVGKQIECVVCLEEYVDGQSRVMSLPCGHEFHAECMYVCNSHLSNCQRLTFGQHTVADDSPSYLSYLQRRRCSSLGSFFDGTKFRVPGPILR